MPQRSKCACRLERGAGSTIKQTTSDGYIGQPCLPVYLYQNQKNVVACISTVGMVCSLKSGPPWRMVLSRLEDAEITRKHHTAEEIVIKLRQIELLSVHGKATVDASRAPCANH